MYTYKYRILELLEVIDGDTIRAIVDLGFNVHMKMDIRITTIDAPSIRTLNEEVKKYGYRAKAELEKYLQDAPEIIITTENPNKTKTFGRVLADVYAVGKDLTASEYLLANNYVWVFVENKRITDVSLLTPL